MTSIFIWYLVLFAFGVSAMPIGYFIFKDRIDYGYPFYRIIGILFISYITWLLSALKLMPFNVYSIIISFALLIGISIYLFTKNKLKINKVYLTNAIYYEILFFVLFVLLIWFKYYRSDISDIEKFMDFSILNTLLRTDYVPPIDPWYSSSTINYYYFGHFITAMLTKITGITSGISYNLMQATNYVLFLTAVYSIVFNLTKRRLISFTGIVFTGFLANINYLLIYIQKKTMAYWWEGTRIIPGTINEFPLYSFLLGDLHAHYLNLPYVTLFIIILFVFYKGKRNLWLNFSLGFLLGIFYMINSWDFLVYGVLFGITYLAKHEFKIKEILISWKEPFVTALVGALTFLPFYIKFNPASMGFHLVTASRSTLRDFVILFSFQIFVVLFYLIFRFYKKKLESKDLLFLVVLFIVSLLFGLWSQVAGLTVFLIGLLINVNISKIKEIQFVDLLLLGALLIVLFCEFFYLKDIYGIEWQRANTIFKLHYQFWVLVSIVCSYIVYYFFDTKDKLKYLFFSVGTVLFIASIIFVPDLFNASADEFKKVKGLDGTRYLSDVLSEDLKAIDWINENIKGTPIILEAVGDSYTTDSRISSFTGLPTPIGWFGHEWGWRNDPDNLNIIKKDIESIYKSNDESLIEKNIKKYNISYIYFGNKELIKYGEKNIFENINFEKVFSFGSTSIYKVK